MMYNEKSFHQFFLKLLIASALFTFAISCHQPNAIQAEEESDLIEQMWEIRKLHITPDSMHVLLNALRTENAHRMTENEKVTFYNERGIIYMAAQNLEAGEKNLLRALYYLEKLNNRNLGRQARIMMNIGTMRMRQMSFDEALNIYRQAIALIENHPDYTEEILMLKASKVDIFMFRNETDPALYYAQSLLAIASEEGFRLWEAMALKNIAVVFFHLERFAQAEENLQTVIPIFTEYNNQVMLWRAYHNLANVLFALNRMEEGLVYVQKNNEIAAVIGFPQVGMAFYYERRGAVYVEQGRYADGLAMFYQALALMSKIQEARLMAEYQSRIGNIYIRMGNLDTAYYYLNTARGIAQENRFLRVEADAQSYLAVIYAVRGDVDNSLTAIAAEKELRRQIFNEQNIRVLHEMQVLYEVRERELVIDRQKEAIRQQYIRNTLLTIVIIVIIILFAVIVFFQRRKVQNITHIVQQYEALAKLKKESDLEKTAKKPNDAVEKLLQDLLHLFESEKIYRRQGLDLQAVAKMLNTNQNYLSQAVGLSSYKNYSELINAYRIEEAIELIKEQDKGGKYARYTIQAIAEQVGFNSRTTFYAAFRQAVGVTPVEYKNTINQTA